MTDLEWNNKEAQRSLKRLLPQLEERFRGELGDGSWNVFTERLRRHFPRLFGLLHRLYGGRYDFFYHLEMILTTAAGAWLARPDELKSLDAMRAADPAWYKSRRMIGAMAYVDLFAGDLEGLRDRIPYLTELGVSSLHLMPLFASPELDDDGGYAISSYRDVDPELGDVDELRRLAGELRQHGISLILDFVFNHTSDEHAWAHAALGGDEEHQAFYRMFPDRDLPDRYEQTVRPVFIDDHPGCFTYRSRIRKWVWTTFHNYQWDLNYENPAVFDAMAGEMLFLANLGVEILRLDAVAFIWKRLGTSCENLPEAHLVIQAFNAVCQIVAPATVFKSEAIVHPDEVARYIRPDECPLSYNPLLMALLWEALATHDVRLLRRSMDKRFGLADGCAWVNYVRCHDDIGWTFSDDDARELGIDGGAHRRFLNAFYTGRHESSFARGALFQLDERTGDARVSGTLASLAGLEQALERGDPAAVDLAVRRILLLHGVIFTIGGIPLIYLGDELGTLNDPSYADDPEKMGDNRWMHRPAFDAARAEQRRDPDSPIGRIFQGLLQLVQLRVRIRAFEAADTTFVDVGSDRVLAYFRQHDEDSVLVLANFTGSRQALDATRLRQLGLRRTLNDLMTGQTFTAMKELTIEPYQLMVLLGSRR